MVEIIERGTKHISNCHECGCKFSYENEDVLNDVVETFKFVRTYVICPQCGKKVIIKQCK